MSWWRLWSQTAGFVECPSATNSSWALLSCSHSELLLPHLQNGTRDKRKQGESGSTLICEGVQHTLRAVWGSAATMPCSTLKSGTRGSQDQPSVEVNASQWSRFYCALAMSAWQHTQSLIKALQTGLTQQATQGGRVIVPILHKKKLRLREAEYIFPNHKARKQCMWPGLLTLKTLLSSPHSSPCPFLVPWLQHTLSCVPGPGLGAEATAVGNMNKPGSS